MNKFWEKWEIEDYKSWIFSNESWLCSNYLTYIAFAIKSPYLQNLYFCKTSFEIEKYNQLLNKVKVLDKS